MKVFDQVKQIICDYKGKAIEIDSETTFKDLDFDSLDTVDLMMQMEEQLDIKFDDDLQIETFGELVQKVEELLK